MSSYLGLRILSLTDAVVPSPEPEPDSGPNPDSNLNPDPNAMW